MSHEITKLNLEVKRLKEQVENLFNMLRAQSVAFVQLKAQIGGHAAPPKVGTDEVVAPKSA